MPSPSFFDGLAAPEVAEISRSLESRRFPAGAVVLAEGDQPQEMYVTRAGTADIFVSDGSGAQHRIARLGVGAPVGEMSLLTGLPCVGTVRAASDLEVLVVGEQDFDRLAQAFPQLQRNLGVLLADRLARTNRLSVGATARKAVFLVDAGAPPLLGYALACSVAWHTRADVLLLVVDDEPAPPIRSRATLSPDELFPYGGGRSTGERSGRPRARVATVPCSGAYAPDLLAGTVADLSASFEHVLVQTRRLPPGHEHARVLTLGARAGGRRHANDSYAVVPSNEPAERRGVSRDGFLRVPTFAAADDEALAEGLLPPRTPAGRALARCARDVAGLRVGLALGAGSSKGYAHIGVLRALEALGVEIDCVAGTSVGALVAAGYAIGLAPDEIADVLDANGNRLFRPTIPLKSLSRNAGLREVLRAQAGDRQIEDLPLPLAVVAADLLTRREVVFRSGSLWLAVLASISIPGIYPAQQVGPYSLVDGGVVNPVPSNVAAELGSDVVLAVRLGGGSTDADWATPAVEGPGRPPSVLEVITRSIEIMQSKITTETASAATIVITPAFGAAPGLALRQFTNGRSFVELGEAAVDAASPRLAAALPWLRTAAHEPQPTAVG